MIIPYENLSSNKKAKAEAVIEAYDSLQNGWSRRGYPVININNKIPWALSSHEERSWNFYIHSWDMIDTLLYAYNLAPEDKLFAPVLAIALDWIDQYVDLNTNTQIVYENSTDFAWYDMAVGLRAYRLSYIYDEYVRTLKNENSVSKKLWSGLLAHQAYLALDKNIAFHSNHGYYQASGQIAMGRRFKDVSSIMAQALSQGTQRFRDMLGQQFTTEGVHREHSPDYHRMVYDTLIGVVQAGLIDDDYIIQLTYKIEKALSWFVMPDGRISNFGDSDWRQMRRKSRIAKIKWQTEEMRFVVTNGEIGHLDNLKLKTFQDAGYYIVRSYDDMTNQDTQSYVDYSYLAQTAAFHSRTHKQADDLSFIWYDHGHNILIDAGRYGYIGKAEMGTELWKQGHWYTHPNRLYCESTRAHNTLEFDNIDYARKGVKPYGSAIARHREYPNGLVVLETECKHFKSIRRARVLIYMPKQWLIVYDWFKDNLNELHDVKQWFNFASEIKVEKLNQAYSCQLDDQTQLHITSLLPNISASEVFNGETQPRKQGWFSPAEREFLPVDSVNYQLQQCTSGVIATLFSFNGQVNLDASINSASTSGRQLKVHWEDLQGGHSIHLTREVDSEINVKYKIDSTSKPMKISDTYIFNPYKNKGIKEQVRLVIYDYEANDYAHLAIIEALDSYQLEKDQLAPHESYKYKYQVLNTDPNGKKWIDTEYGYQDLKSGLQDNTKIEIEIEIEQNNELSYEYIPAKQKSEYLTVFFQSGSSEFDDRFIKYLSEANTNLLYIKDGFGSDEELSSTYYLNENNQIPVADLVQKLITEASGLLKVDKNNTVFIGKGKGGFASLYHGYIYGAGYVLAIKPPVLLGDFLFKRSSKNISTNIFKSVFGNLNKKNKDHANNLIKNIFKIYKNRCPITFIYTEDDKNFYKKNLNPLLQWADEINIPKLSIEFLESSSNENSITEKISSIIN
ncbi:heparinase II/III domain-containing protein [Psychrobacter alimentarius]|uniref:heparinase II/III domain-containing protein n=1 Tax=Psychrobacter alimentarius TaxID=261164 RepID=UPI003FD4C055